MDSSGDHTSFSSGNARYDAEYYQDDFEFSQIPDGDIPESETPGWVIGTILVCIMLLGLAGTLL